MISNRDELAGDRKDFDGIPIDQVVENDIVDRLWQVLTDGERLDVLSVILVVDEIQRVRHRANPDRFGRPFVRDHFQQLLAQFPVTEGVIGEEALKTFPPNLIGRNGPWSIALRGGAGRHCAPPEGNGGGRFLLFGRKVGECRCR